MLTCDNLEKWKEALKKYYRLKYLTRENLDIHDHIFINNMEFFALCHNLDL